MRGEGESVGGEFGDGKCGEVFFGGGDGELVGEWGVILDV